MKLSLSLCASLISLGVIPSSVSLAQSGWFWQSPLPQGNRLSAVSALDSDTITAVGDVGTILRTTDGGATWTLQTSGTTTTLWGVSLVDCLTVTNSYVYVTGYAGRTWLFDRQGP